MINFEVHLLSLLLILQASCVDAQVDTNKDRLVSMSEFLAATKKEDFLQKDEWEVRARFYRNSVILQLTFIGCKFFTSYNSLTSTDFRSKPRLHRGGDEGV